MERRKTASKNAPGLEERFDRVKGAFNASMVPWNHGRTKIFLKPSGKGHKLVLKHSLTVTLRETEDRALGMRLKFLKERLKLIPGLKVLPVRKTPLGGGNFVHELEMSHEGKPFDLKKLDTIPHLASLKGVRDLQAVIRHERGVLSKGKAKGGEILIGEIPHQ